tara:strand:+ start:266 stop:424 length:159 start_codon:yes stop_codon:yes gene_type:complete
MSLAGLLDSVRHAHEHFERDEEIDELQRLEFIGNICLASAASQEETDLINRR